MLLLYEEAIFKEGQERKKWLF